MHSSSAVLVALCLLGALACAHAAGKHHMGSDGLTPAYCKQLAPVLKAASGPSTVIVDPTATAAVGVADYRYIARRTAPGGDIDCGQKTDQGQPQKFCKICDGVTAVADACDSNPKWVCFGSRLLQACYTALCISGSLAWCCKWLQ